MREALLFQSPMVTIREVVCDAALGHSDAPERNEMPCIAIPIRGCYSVERRRHEVVGDTNTAIFFDTEMAYRVSHPAEGGDVTFAVTYAGEAFAGAFGEAQPTHAPLGASTQLHVRLLRRRLRCVADAIAIEEASLAIATAIAGTARIDLSAKRVAAVERAKAFLGANFRNKVLLADVARAAGLSPFSLARAFPAATGVTLHQYLIALRHAAALDDIAEGASDLSRVAVDAGFAHHSHLTKTFAKAFGATPSRLRARLTG